LAHTQWVVRPDTFIQASQIGAGKVRRMSAKREICGIISRFLRLSYKISFDLRPQGWAWFLSLFANLPNTFARADNEYGGGNDCIVPHYAIFLTISDHAGT